MGLFNKTETTRDICVPTAVGAKLVGNGIAEYVPIHKDDVIGTEPPCKAGFVPIRVIKGWARVKNELDVEEIPYDTLR